MPDQPTLGVDARSAFPRRAGVPWWAAVLIAVTATLVGFAIEAGSGHQELGTIFAICYALGCIAAVLAVRQSAIFTAIIQPPLLLFVAVPLGYFLLHSSAFGGLKDVAISCFYPLIERFPLMLFTSAATLLIGLIRWYMAMSAPAQPAAAAPAGPGPSGLFSGLAAKLSSAVAGNGTEADDRTARSARPRHGRAGGTRDSRPPRERAATGSRRPRPVMDDYADAPPRPRRDTARRSARDADYPMDPPRRRPREQRDPRRTPPPVRREPRERREDYAPRPARDSRFEPYESGRGYQSRPDYDPYPPQPPRRRPAPDNTHHPVSRVRYRDSGPSDDDWGRPGR